MPTMFAIQSRIRIHLVAKGLLLSLLLSPCMLRCSARCYLHLFPVVCLDTFWTRFGHALDTVWTRFGHAWRAFFKFGHVLDTFWTLFGHVFLDTVWTLWTRFGHGGRRELK